MLRGILLCSVVLFSEVRTEGSGPMTVLDVEPAVERQRLRSDLLRDYDSNTGHHPTVRLSYEPRHLLGLDEKNQIVSVTGILELRWTDPLLKWDPASYSGITQVRFDPDKVWLPKIQAAFNVRPTSVSDPPPVLVSSEGSVRWFPPFRFDVPCSADYRHYPFDTHACELLLFDNRGVRLDTTHGDVVGASAEGSEWVLGQVSHSVQALQEHPFYRIRVQLHLHRKSRIYRYVCVLPTLLAIATLLCGFWLLPCDPSRYVIGCANVVVLTLLLQHLATTLPSANGLPIIAQYSASCLCLSSLFVVFSALNHLLRRSVVPPPGPLLRLARLSVFRPLCLFSFSHVSSAQEEGGASEATPPEERKRRSDWLLVSVLVDRLTFWCFSLVFAVLLAVLAAL